MTAAVLVCPKCGAPRTRATNKRGLVCVPCERERKRNVARMAVRRRRADAAHPAPSPEPVTANAPEPDSPTIGRHHANLMCLGTELAELAHLGDLWAGLAKELEQTEQTIEGVVDDILAGDADDVALSAKSVRVASLSAQIAAVRKRACQSGRELQARLPEDIAAVDWLARNWLAYRLEAETAKILELVSREKREALHEVAAQLAEAGTAYEASVVLLGASVLVNYLWTRPLEEGSEKSATSTRLIADPIYKAPDPRETINNLLSAGRALLTRWTVLLEAVAKEGSDFTAPPYEEPEPYWGPPEGLEGVSAGPPTEGVFENPIPPQIKGYWHEEEIEEDRAFFSPGVQR